MKSLVIIFHDASRRGRLLIREGGVKSPSPDENSPKSRCSLWRGQFLTERGQSLLFSSDKRWYQKSFINSPCIDFGGEGGHPRTPPWILEIVLGTSIWNAKVHPFDHIFPDFEIFSLKYLVPGSYIHLWKILFTSYAIKSNEMNES